MRVRLSAFGRCRSGHAGADKRLGDGMATTGFQWEWGDAENAINKWCEMTADPLSSWTSGAATP